MTTPAPRPQSLEHTTYLALLQAHEALAGEGRSCFQDGGLSEAQFNTLRIVLRGPAEGATCREIGEQLLRRVPDVTRLVDRMERDGLVTRARDDRDRRVVRVRATAEGKRRCEALYQPLHRLHERQFAHLSREELGELNRLLRTLFAERAPFTTDQSDTQPGESR